MTFKFFNILFKKHNYVDLFKKNKIMAQPFINFYQIESLKLYNEFIDNIN